MPRIITVFLLLLFVIIPVSALDYDIRVESEVVQGQVLKILVEAAEDITLLEGVIRYNSKTISYGEGFLLERYSGTNSAYLMLLPVSSTQSIGDAVLKLTLEIEDESIEVIRDVEIVAGEFISEEIPLNSDMTKLRSEPDEEKQRQSRILYALLQEYHSDSVFHKGPFIIPVEPLRLTSFFGDRRVFIYSNGDRSNSIHSGIDYSAVPGTFISACGDGKIVFSDERITTGNTIVIEHLPGVYSLYYHMKDRFVAVGDMVTAGKLIGTVGATGLATGAHLHWEIRVNAVPVAPDPLVESALLSLY